MAVLAHGGTAYSPVNLAKVKLQITAETVEKAIVAEVIPCPDK
jgi:hypothetical protein